MEAEHRRPELLMYILPRSIQIAANLIEMEFMKSPASLRLWRSLGPPVSVAVFSAGLAALLFTREADTGHVTGLTQTVATRVFTSK